MAKEASVGAEEVPAPARSALARRATAIGHVASMAAIVATLCYFPIGIGIAVASALFGVPLDTLLTFGGALNRYVGLIAWWLAFFAPALVYAALVFPWDEMLKPR